MRSKPIPRHDCQEREVPGDCHALLEEGSVGDGLKIECPPRLGRSESKFVCGIVTKSWQFERWEVYSLLAD